MGRIVAICGLLLLSIFCPSLCVDTTSQCHKKLIQKELYRSLYRVIKENVICTSQKAITNVELQDLGTPLSFEDFSPGKPSLTTVFSQPGALPQSVVENGMPLVDQVYPTGTNRFLLPTNYSDDKDYRFDSFSSTYDYILTHMMLLPRNFSDEEVLRAKYYLQELVPNPELVLRNETKLPRFMLYDYYRSNYLQVKGVKDDAIDTNRTHLTQLKFELWGQQKLSRFESDTEAAYVKWQAFGYKSEVEKQLQFFDVDTHEDKLMNTRALFKSMGRPSEREAHRTIYPFTLEPSNWFEQLRAVLPESADELQYKKSLLQAKEALLIATRSELNNKTSSDIARTQSDIERSLESIRELIDNGVDKLLQMELECFTQVNLTVCGQIIDGHVAFRSLLDDLAEHFMQSEYLTSILNRKGEVLKVIQDKLSEVVSDIKVLDSQIAKKEREEAAEAIESSTSITSESTSCPGVGQIKFTFDSQSINSDAYCQQQDTEADQVDCIDIEVPSNATSRDLWNVKSCTVDSELKSFNVLEPFVKLMNSIPVKVSASLLKVDVHRPWFDSSLFENADHFTMKRGRGVVSPGPLTPSFHFQQVAHSGKYLLPHYMSAFIIASNVKLFFPGLGSWNASADQNQTNEAINTLMKYAYAPVLTGGVGPFSFEFPAGVQHNFQIRRRNGGLQITLPGGQVIGYVMKTMPKFPLNQSKPEMNAMECDRGPTSSPIPNHRTKRSAMDDNPNPGMLKIKELARSLFSERLGPVVPEEHLQLMRDREVVSARYIDKLIRDGDMKREELAEFIRSFEKKDSPTGSPNSTYTYE